MSRRILVVDDSPSLRRMIAMTLKGAGYDVVEAEDGLDALERVAAARFDAVLTDQNMPRMDGLSFIREFKSRPEGQGIPVVFLSTESEGELKDKARAAGALGWMTKPFDQAKLLSVMARVVGA
ncbi:response regulator [Rubellimicrobium rubrum]|uniref:Response regulator n=1 Tax=Rubellimicrobium rubrum TaxID=2585369 RepID=A0A5C4N3J2_9RHOB|nr:response regulator [Rubellimicrobium rubrum]TNC51997.1 response regulator [Rubellimicrobium rubrum]